MTGMSARRKKQRMAAIGSAPPFDPLVNYANGEQGVYYAPWDISTLWQDDARTVPVENYGDPVRVMDDLSPNGNHAVAPTSAARGTYGRMPAGVGIRNLLVYSEPTSNTGWEGVNAEITGAGDGWSRVTKTEGDDSAWVHQRAFLGDGEEIRTGYVRVRRGNTRYVWLTSKRTPADNNTRSLIFDFEEPGFTRNAIVGSTPFFEDLGDGTFLIGYSAPTAAAPGPAECFGIGPCTHPGQQQMDVPIGAYVDFTRAQVNTGDEPLPYQRVGNQYDVSQEDVPDVYYIETDGIDDCYQTAPIDLTMYDSTSLDVACQYLGAIGAGGAALVAEFSPSIADSNGAYDMARSGTGLCPWLAQHKGTTQRSLRGTESADHKVAILSMSASISEPDLTAILQGELLNTTASQGSGNLGDYPLNLFSRNASSNFFQGRLFGAIIVHPRSIYERQNKIFLEKKIFGRTVNVILVAGQSNADGRAPIDTGPAWIQSGIVPGISAFDGSELRPYDLSDIGSQGNGTAWVSGSNSLNKFGFADITCYELGRVLPRLVVCRVTQGASILAATSLASGSWNADYNAIPEGTPKLLQDLETKIAQLKDWAAVAKLNLNFVGLLWHQGEADDNSHATAYEENLRQLISSVRSFTRADLPIVSGTIPAESARYNATIRDAMLDTASTVPGVTYRNNNGIGLLGDDLHFNAQGSVDFGNWAAGQILETYS